MVEWTIWAYHYINILLTRFIPICLDTALFITSKHMQNDVVNT